MKKLLRMIWHEMTGGHTWYRVYASRRLGLGVERWECNCGVRKEKFWR